MKTYIFSLIEKYKQFSQIMDVQSVLCSKAWYVLNEDSNSEVLIFKSDNTGYASVDGDTRIFKWEFLPQNGSLLINHDEMKGTMLKPSYFENGILVCQKDGTQECMFLIDDSLSPAKKFQTLTSVKESLTAIANKHEEKKKLEEKAKIEAELAAKKKAEEEWHQSMEKYREKLRKEKWERFIQQKYVEELSKTSKWKLEIIPKVVKFFVWIFCITFGVIPLILLMFLDDGDSVGVLEIIEIIVGSPFVAMMFYYLLSGLFYSLIHPEEALLERIKEKYPFR